MSLCGFAVAAFMSFSSEGRLLSKWLVCILVLVRRIIRSLSFRLVLRVGVVAVGLPVGNIVTSIRSIVSIDVV